MVQFTDQEKEILEANYPHWETLRDGGWMRNLDNPTFQNLKSVYNRVFQPGPINQYCAACIAEMVTKLFTQYDKVKTAVVNIVEEVKTIIDVVNDVTEQTTPAPVKKRRASRKKKS